MNSRGEIVISCQEAENKVGDAELQPDFSTYADMVLVRVSDSGCGIDAQALSWVTEPFYTTKRIGEGSGLGLSSVARFVEQSGGSMHIESELAVGTTINLFLPAGIKHYKNQPTERVEPKATVLIVDDEAAIRRLLATWLARNDYEVLVAANSKEAIDRLQSRDGAVDFLFSDLVMPGEMDGSEIVAYVADTYPHIISVIATGYADRVSNKNRTDTDRGIVVISKPYNLADLTKMISEKLEARSAPDVRLTNSEGPNGH